MADAGMTIRYAKRDYEEKISEIQEYINTLQTHLDTLEGLRDQVPNFWDDPQTPDYLAKLTKAIKAVQNSMDQSQKLLDQYKGTVEQMDAANTKTSEFINQIGSQIDALGING